MSRCLAIAWAIAVATACCPPASAARWLASANSGRDTVALLPGGDVQVFSGPGQPLARHAFGPDAVGLTAAPSATLVGVLLSHDGRCDLICWNYADDTVAQAPDTLAKGVAGIGFNGDGRSVFLAQPDAQAVREISGFLSPEHRVPAVRLPVGNWLPLTVSALDLYLAVASRDCVYLGPARGGALVRYDLTLSAVAAPTLRFTRDARWLVAGGDAQIVVLPSIGGMPRRLPLAGIAASPAFDLSSDGESLFLAEAGRVCRLDLGTGALRDVGNLRTDNAKPRDVVTCSLLGAVAVSYEDGRVGWYYPGKHASEGLYPPLIPKPLGPVLPTGTGPTTITPPPGTGLRPTTTTTPGSATAGSATAPAPKPATVEPMALLGATRRALTDGGLLKGERGGGAVVLDHDYKRMPDLEKLAGEQGWAALTLALVATWVGHPEQVPAGWQTISARLGQVDLVELRAVVPVAEPARFEAALGPALETGTCRVAGDGKPHPVYRFGPFALALDPQRAQFADGAWVVLASEFVQQAVARK